MNFPLTIRSCALVLAAAALAGCANPAVGIASAALNVLTGAGGGAPASHQSGPMSASQARALAQSALGEVDRSIQGSCVNRLPPPPPPSASGNKAQCEVRYVCLPGMHAPVRSAVCERDGAAGGGGISDASADARMREPAPWSFATAGAPAQSPSRD